MSFEFLRLDNADMILIDGLRALLCEVVSEKRIIEISKIRKAIEQKAASQPFLSYVAKRGINSARKPCPTTARFQFRMQARVAVQLCQLRLQLALTAFKKKLEIFARGYLSSFAQPFPPLGPAHLLHYQTFLPQLVLLLGCKTGH